MKLALSIIRTICGFKTCVVKIKDKFVKDVDEFEDKYVILADDIDDAMRFTWINAHFVACSHYGKVKFS